MYVVLAWLGSETSTTVPLVHQDLWLARALTIRSITITWPCHILPSPSPLKVITNSRTHKKLCNPIRGTILIVQIAHTKWSKYCVFSDFWLWSGSSVSLPLVQVAEIKVPKITPTRHLYLDLCRHGNFFVYPFWLLPRNMMRRTMTFEICSHGRPERPAIFSAD